MKLQKQSMAMPDALVILFFVGVLAALAAWWVPAGSYETQTVTRSVNGETQQRSVIIPESFRYADDESFQRPLFAEGGEIGLANVPFEGLVSGSKWGAAIGVIAFILVVGGAFGMILKTTSIERGILALIEKTRHFELLFLTSMFLAFSLSGAIFGMGEEAIAFCLVLLPVMRSLGYDAVTTVLTTYVATQIGFATSWMNPFSVAIAQGIAEVPLLSGSGFRIILWCVFTLFGLQFTLRYARRIKQPVINEREPQSVSDKPFRPVDTAILLMFLIGLGWVIWGVTQRQYYIPEIAAQFFVMGLTCGLIAVIGRRLSANDLAQSFNQGAKDLLPAALIVGFAKGIVLLLGGDDATTPSVLNTVLHTAGNTIGEFSTVVSASLMLMFQSVFNFFIASGSGQAALTMPLMAPLSDLVGVSRQTAVLAFQLGDGLTNIIIPTSASLIGCLGAVKLDWGAWVKIIWKFQLGLMLMSLAAMILAVTIGFS
ncbi:MAG: putative basic amino acid antiporter YfcC [Pseudomonadota bacterium]